MTFFPRLGGEWFADCSGMEVDRSCPEGVRLLRFAKAALNHHSEILVGLRNVSGAGPEIFEAFMGEVSSSRRVKQAFKAYTDHLDRHGCGRFKTS